MFKAPFSFKGRIRRLEYGLSILIFAAIYIGLGFNMMKLVQVHPLLGLLGFLMIPLLWFHFAQGAKRCHDLGNSGWYQLIPFYGFWMLFANSEDGENEYGPNPKGIGNKKDDIEKHLVD